MSYRDKKLIKLVGLIAIVFLMLIMSIYIYLVSMYFSSDEAYQRYLLISIGAIALILLGKLFKSALKQYKNIQAIHLS